MATFFGTAKEREAKRRAAKGLPPKSDPSKRKQTIIIPGGGSTSIRTETITLPSGATTEIETGRGRVARIEEAMRADLASAPAPTPSRDIKAKEALGILRRDPTQRGVQEVFRRSPQARGVEEQLGREEFVQITREETPTEQAFFLEQQLLRPTLTEQKLQMSLPADLRGPAFKDVSAAELTAFQSIKPPSPNVFIKSFRAAEIKVSEFIKERDLLKVGEAKKILRIQEKREFAETKKVLGVIPSIKGFQPVEVSFKSATLDRRLAEIRLGLREKVQEKPFSASVDLATFFVGGGLFKLATKAPKLLKIQKVLPLVKIPKFVQKGTAPGIVGSLVAFETLSLASTDAPFRELGRRTTRIVPAVAGFKLGVKAGDVLATQAGKASQRAATKFSSALSKARQPRVDTVKIRTDIVGQGPVSIPVLKPDVVAVKLSKTTQLIQRGEFLGLRTLITPPSLQPKLPLSQRLLRRGIDLRSRVGVADTGKEFPQFVFGKGAQVRTQKLSELTRIGQKPFDIQRTATSLRIKDLRTQMSLLEVKKIPLPDVQKNLKQFGFTQPVPKVQKTPKSLFIEIREGRLVRRVVFTPDEFFAVRTVLPKPKELPKPVQITLTKFFPATFKVPRKFRPFGLQPEPVRTRGGKLRVIPGADTSQVSVIKTKAIAPSRFAGGRFEEEGVQFTAKVPTLTGLSLKIPPLQKLGVIPVLGVGIIPGIKIDTKLGERLKIDTTVDTKLRGKTLQKLIQKPVTDVIPKVTPAVRVTPRVRQKTDVIPKIGLITVQVPKIRTPGEPGGQPTPPPTPPPPKLPPLFLPKLRLSFPTAEKKGKRITGRFAERSTPSVQALIGNIRAPKIPTTGKGFVLRPITIFNQRRR